jgi:hypothetical protein
MLLYPDGKTALQTALDPLTLELTPEGAMVLDSAARTVPSGWGEFVAAAQLLIYSIRTGIVAEAEIALAHAEALLSAVESGRLDGRLLHYLRQIVTHCRPLEDGLTFMLVGSMMEAFRPRQIDVANTFA